MTMTDEEREVVERLRSVPPCDGCGEYPGTAIGQLMDRAADLIERMAAERATIRREARREALERAHDGLVVVPAASIEQEQAIQRCQAAIRALDPRDIVKETE